MNGHHGAVSLGVFHHHNGIGGGRDRGTRHDFYRFSGCNSDIASFGSGSGLDLPDATQTRRRCSDVGSPHRITIACGAGKRREITVGAQVFGKHKTESLKQGEHLGLSRRERGSVLLNGLSRFGKR
jgi:hypothetical protein